MRKIISKEKSEKKAKRNQLIGGLVLILMMLLSVVGYSLNSKERVKIEKLNYKGQTFIKQNGFWTLNFETLSFSFTYSPEEVPVFNSEINPIINYSNIPLYINSDDSEVFLEIYRNLFENNKIVQRVGYACIDLEECKNGYPLKTCEDHVIVIQETNSSSKLRQEGNCVFIEGKKENLLKNVDGFLLKLIKIQ